MTTAIGAGLVNATEADLVLAPPVKAKSERCETCRFWRRWKAEPSSLPGGDFGSCRRRPPVIAGTFSIANVDPVDVPTGNEIVASTWFPPTNEDEWCGEFEWLPRLEPLGPLC